MTDHHHRLRTQPEAGAPPIDTARLDEAAQHCATLRDDLLRLWAEAATRYADALEPSDANQWRDGLHALEGAASLIGAGEVLGEAMAARLACDVLGRGAAKARLQAAAARSTEAAWALLGLSDLPSRSGL